MDFKSFFFGRGSKFEMKIFFNWIQEIGNLFFIKMSRFGNVKMGWAGIFKVGRILRARR